jgi:hypothetical protein
MIRPIAILAGILLGAPLGWSAEPETKRLELIVKETAGLRRFGFPVHVTFRTDRDVTETDRFRLVANGKPVTAQFRSLRALGQRRLVALDFNVNQDPLEQKTFQIEYGSKVVPGAEPKGGLEVIEDKETVTIKSGNLRYVVARKPRGLFTQVSDGKREYVRKGGGGFDFLTRGHGTYGLGLTETMTITRRGPLAVGIRFHAGCPIDKDPKKRSFDWQIDLTFPRAKSWVEVDWTVNDPAGVLSELHAGLALLLDGSPTLADFGAGSMVYTTLRKNEAAYLIAPVGGKPAWKVETSRDEEPRRLFAVANPRNAQPPEGWAHSMDRQRCTAVAMAEFGQPGAQDEIHFEGGGQLVFVRKFDQHEVRRQGRKRLRFWAHFVPMPVHIGALTSPQSMMAPLVVEVKNEPRRK